MGMEPHSQERGDRSLLPHRLDLGCEVVLVELCGSDAHLLLGDPEVRDEQGVVGVGDAEGEDLGLAEVTQVVELGPRIGVESERRSGRLVGRRLPA